MGETHQYNHHHHHHHHNRQQYQQQQQEANTSRVGMRNPDGGGEIVEVQGGHIVRSTGKKDRHSKVCTAKGPRDRRVRLSAHTAIQFYDVQDRLGYDRPSKAVDWLIKKAKSAIDELEELPAWKPTTTKAPQGEEEKTQQHQQQQQHQQHQHQQRESSGSDKDYNSNNIQMDSFQISFQNQQAGSGFLPPSLDSDAIADTIKSFFPMGASGGGEATAPPSGNSMQQFQSYPAPDLLSRTSSCGRHNQDLRLSLQSFQEPHQVLFPGPSSGAHHYLGGGFDGSSSSGGSGGGGWSEQHQNPVEIGRFQRMVATWNTGGGDNNIGSGGGGGFIFNSLPPPPPPQTAVLQPMLFGQRGPLQSSNSPSVRAWIDPVVGIADQIPQFHPGMGLGGFSGFRVPARIQGDQEELDGIPNKPSSASSDSRH